MSFKKEGQILFNLRNSRKLPQQLQVFPFVRTSDLFYGCIRAFINIFELIKSVRVSSSLFA